MGHANKVSLNQQLKDELQKRLRIGESKYAHKIAGDAHQYIFSWNTYHTYYKHACYFLKWAKTVHKCKTLAECHKYVNEWIQARIDQGLSAFTIKLEVAALCKLYGTTATDYISTPKRLRKNIKRSRGPAVRDKHFVEANHSDLVEFCRSTGLRRAELKALTGDKLVQDADGNYRILVNKMSKGGRPREALIIGDVPKIVSMMQAAGTGKVFDRIPVSADIHSYRADYATAIYKMFARPIKDILETNRKDLFFCRGDRRGTWMDRRAMKTASLNLGHSRISVVSISYIRDI